MNIGYSCNHFLHKADFLAEFRKKHPAGGYRSFQKFLKENDVDFLVSPERDRDIVDRFYLEGQHGKYLQKNARRQAPKVSVVIPVHAVEDYLDDCLKSISRQSLQDLEIIVVDDCSPGDDHEIIFRHMLADPRIIYVRTRQNRGLLLVRQIGARFARGKYLTFVDGDDFLAPDIYEKALANAETNNADILQFAMWRVPEDGDIEVRPSTISPRFLIKDGDIFRSFLRGEIDFSMCNKLIRLSLWRECEAYFPTRHYKLEDISRLPYLCLHAKTFIGIKYPGYYYRIRSDSGARVKTLNDRGWRAYCAARHVARLKKTLADMAILDRYLDDVGRFERSMYDTYVSAFARAANYRFNEARRLQEEARAAKGRPRLLASSTPADAPEPLALNISASSPVDMLQLERAINVNLANVGVRWMRRIMRINGFIPLRLYLSIHSPLLEQVDSEIARIRSDSFEGPMVSIIVPAYNVEKYLDRCLLSLQQQTFEDFEVLVVNDCSSDGTAEIIDAWVARDARFRRIDNPENRGLFRTRISGLRHARGRYVWHVDGDDHVSPVMLEKMLASLLENNSDVVQSGRIEIDEMGNMRKNLACHVPSFEFSEIVGALLNCKGISHSIWNKIYKREVWLAAMKFLDLFDRPEEVRRDCGEDFFFNVVALSLCERFSHVPESYYYYAVRENSFMANRAKDLAVLKMFSINAVRNMQIARYMMHFFKKYPTEAINRKDDSYAFAKIREFILHDEVGTEQAVDFLADATRLFSPYYVLFCAHVFGQSVRTRFNAGAAQQQATRPAAGKPAPASKPAPQNSKRPQAPTPPASPAGETTKASNKILREEGAQTSPPRPGLVSRLEQRMVRRFCDDKKFEKFIHSPEAFFADSRHVLLRLYGRMRGYRYH